MPRFASVLLVDPEGRLLMQERDEHPVIDPECWGFPGGHVDEGEDAEAAAYRELEEETGVVAPPGSLQHVGVVEVWHEAYGSRDPVHVYAGATTRTDAEIECREGRQMVFVEPAAAVILPLTHGAARILPAFLVSDLYRELATR